MPLFGLIFLSMLASLGVALAFLEFYRRARAKETDFICVCFKNEPAEDQKPDMVIICRTEAEEDEIIRRIGENDGRRIYLKHL